MKKTKHYFIEGLLSLRAAAAQIFAHGVVKGASPEQISKDIEPLRTAMKHSIQRTVESDLGACVIAVQRLEAIAAAHEQDAAYSMQKASDSRDHAKEIRLALIDNMKKMGVDNYTQEDFTATLVKDSKGNESLALR